MGVQKTVGFKPAGGVRSAEDAQQFLAIADEPVSYTHLDVYKRQNEDREMTRLKDAGTLLALFLGSAMISASAYAENPPANSAQSVAKMCIRDRSKACQEGCYVC